MNSFVSNVRRLDLSAVSLFVWLLIIIFILTSSYIGIVYGEYERTTDYAQVSSITELGDSESLVKIWGLAMI